MGGTFDEALDVDIGAAEGALGFARGVAEGGFEIALAVHPAHALAAASCHSLKQDREAVGAGERAEGVEGDWQIGAGDDGRAGGDSSAARGGLTAHGPNGVGGRSGEDDAPRMPT